MKNKYTLVFFILFFLIFALGCKEDDPTTDPMVDDPVVVNPIEDPDPNEEPDPDENLGEQTIIIDNNGGELKSSDQNLLITVPEGVIDETVEISITENGTNDHPNGIGTMYSLHSDIAQFDEPVFLSFNYNENVLPDGAYPDLLKVAFRREGGGWITKPNAVLDETAKTITIETDHFSEWTLALDSSGFIDVAIPPDTFQINLPFDRMVYADRNMGEYSDTLIFYFQDKSRGFTTTLYEVGSFNITPEAEINMHLSIKSNNVSLYSGPVSVVFSKFGDNSGELISASFSGDIQNTEKFTFPMTGKFVHKKE